MDHRKPYRNNQVGRRLLSILVAQAKLAAMAVTAALLLLATQLPRSLVLPVFSLFALAGAVLVSFIAWRRNDNRNAQHVTAWDVAGAFAFVGFAAAMLSKPDQVLIYFAHTLAT
jgi:ABC-type Fe3+-siderophore transport system permease subunit